MGITSNKKPARQKTGRVTHFVVVLFVLIAMFSAGARESHADFKADQMRNPRVRDAYKKQEAAVQHMFTEKGVPYPADEIFYRAFKLENNRAPGVVELWARARGTKRFKLIRTFNICESSGGPGPKRRSGDGQVPEGFYHVSVFNPASRFHLSLQIDYPNASDRILGAGGDLGGDIFMHGDCVTIGCIPMTDDVIDALYIVAVDAKNRSNRPIAYHIFPMRMNETGMKTLKRMAGGNAVLWRFWQNLREGYAIFEKTGVPPTVSIDKKGTYIFRESQ
jgi:murein L,D-transpeptidase YafK